MTLGAIDMTPDQKTVTVKQADHRCFTVRSTAYLRNLDQEDRQAECLAVHYQRPPVKTETGTSIGLNFPMLVVANYLENQEAVAEKVARILEKHWESEA